jgi:hypothetical protein
VDGGVGLQAWKIAVNILNMQFWIANKGWYSSLGDWGVELTVLTVKVSMLLNVTQMLLWNNTSKKNNGHEVWN